MKSSRSFSSILVFVIISVGIRVIARNYIRSRNHTNKIEYTLPTSNQIPNYDPASIPDNPYSFPSIPIEIDKNDGQKIEQQANETFQECKVSLDKMFDDAKKQFSGDPTFQKLYLQLQIDEILKKLNAIPTTTSVEKEFKQLLLGKINWYITKRMNEIKMGNSNTQNEKDNHIPKADTQQENPIFNVDSTNTK